MGCIEQHCYYSHSPHSLMYRPHNLVISTSCSGVFVYCLNVLLHYVRISLQYVYERKLKAYDSIIDLAVA